MIIDAYSHVCPAPLLEAVLAARPSAAARGLTNSYLWDAGRRLAFMDRVGIDRQVLVLVRPPMWLGMERSEIHRLTRLANEEMATFAAAHPDRFTGVAVMPVVDDEMLAEFRRARDELGLAGVVLFSNIEGLPLDDDSMWPLYEDAAASDVPIWIHPQDGHSYDWLAEHHVDHLFGWPFETSLAMARLVYGGVLERFPDLRFVTHHLGGMVPYYAGRVAAADMRDVDAGGRPFLDDFRRFYGDSHVNGWLPALRCGLEFFGTERVLFGTDFPMGPRDGELFVEQVLGSVRELDVSEADRDAIFSGNALRLLERRPPQP
jgi:predicted TIM-barrel fold metal-dependent hydrolase